MDPHEVLIEVIGDIEDAKVRLSLAEAKMVRSGGLQTGPATRRSRDSSARPCATPASPPTRPSKGEGWRNGRHRAGRKPHPPVSFSA